MPGTGENCSWDYRERDSPGKIDHTCKEGVHTFRKAQTIFHVTSNSRQTGKGQTG
jgi:hypothetical protein